MKNSPTILEATDSQIYREGLRLAQDVREKKLTVEAFALRYARDKRSSIYEGKTGLFSPAFFEEELQQEVAASRRYHQSLTLFIIDVDNLKKLNDSFGHVTGDKAITKVAEMIRRTIRRSDIPCRWGGDEFAVLLPATNTTDSQRLALRLKKLLDSEPIVTEPLRLCVSVSIGIAGLAKADTAQTLFEKADRAVYQSKLKKTSAISVYKK
jgi:diguanylate cyclase (GGDEF)-like protein